MKKSILKVVFIILSVLIFCTISIAQSNTISFTLSITNNCGTSGTIFHGVGWVEKLNYPFPYCYTTPLSPTNLYAGNNSASFDCSVPIDANHKIYKVHVYIQNASNSHCNGYGESGWLTSDELYGYGGGVGTIYVTCED